jgi:nucleoside-diphosphate-sugar epimerase
MAIALVTGGAGFLGSHLVDRLLEAEVVVRVLDNLSTGSLRNLMPHVTGPAAHSAAGANPGRRLEVVLGDVRDEHLVRKAMRQVDCVFHLAALHTSALAGHHQGEMHAVNVQGTLSVLQAATAEGVRRLVFASCGSVYGPTSPGLLIEDDPPRPASLFAASKLAGEIYCRAHSSRYQLETVLLRYFTVYGSRQRASGAMVPALVESLERGVRPLVDGDSHRPRDLLHVDDAVAAMAAAGTAPGAAGLSLNIASGQSATALEVIAILNELLRTGLTPQGGGSPIGETTGARVSPALASRVLGWSASVTLPVGLARLVASAGGGDRSIRPLLAEVGSVEERADL